MPSYAAFTFVGVRGFKLHPGQCHFLDLMHAVPLRTEVQQLPEQRFESPAGDAAAVLRPAFDVLWNAFGLPGSQHYDANGNWSELR